MRRQDYLRRIARQHAAKKRRPRKKPVRKPVAPQVVEERIEVIDSVEYMVKTIRTQKQARMGLPPEAVDQ
jgi:hypothetical protein